MAYIALQYSAAGFTSKDIKDTATESRKEH